MLWQRQCKMNEQFHIFERQHNNLSRVHLETARFLTLRIPGTSSFFFFFNQTVDVHAYTCSLTCGPPKKISLWRMAFIYLPWVQVLGAMVSDTLLWAVCALSIGAHLKETWLIWDSCSVYPRILTPASSWKPWLPLQPSPNFMFY